ncbi:MAG TPA: IS200/IS605 family transposase [Nitrososphaeraceae archaeon]|nr:IS200/IS605 family transposase [Nitrososphaeraceae archaeon]
MEIQNPSKKYHTIDHLVYSCQYHVVFTPKYRRKVLTDDLDMELMPDHVHLLLDIIPKKGVETVVNMIKGYTSHELRKEFPSLKTRLPTLWTHSKFISSVGAVTLEVVKKYIEEQKSV